MPGDLQDATFAVVYKFETKAGKPVNITQVKNDFLEDNEFTACVSHWTVASMSKAVATFLWNPTDGWAMDVSGGKN